MTETTTVKIPRFLNNDIELMGKRLIKEGLNKLPKRYINKLNLKKGLTKGDIITLAIMSLEELFKQGANK